MDKGKLKGHAALWVANIIWGLNAPIGKSVLWSEANPGGVNPFAMSVYRMAGACLLFWAASLFVPRERVAPRDIVLLLFASEFGIQLNQMLFLWGLSLTSPIDTSIIATVVPVLTMVLATLFLREPITWLKAGGVFLGCAGAVILILASQHGTGHTSSMLGDVLCIVSAVSYATYLTAFRDVIVRYSPVTTMKWMFLFAAIVALVIYYDPLTSVDYAALAPRTWAGIAYVVVGSTFLSYLMVPIGQRYLRPTVVSMYNYVQPVVAVLFTVAIGLDTFGITKGFAALCVFVGVWLVTKSKSRAQPSSGPPPKHPPQTAGKRADRQRRRAAIRTPRAPKHCPTPATQSGNMRHGRPHGPITREFRRTSVHDKPRRPFGPRGRFCPSGGRFPSLRRVRSVRRRGSRAMRRQTFFRPRSAASRSISAWAAPYSLGISPSRMAFLMTSLISPISRHGGSP